MEGAYFTYFTNPFESLRMDRPAYKAQLELKFKKAEKVYSFFDFSAAELPKSKKAAVLPLPRP